MTPAPPAADGEWTVRRVLEWTTRHLGEQGSSSPRLDAELLLAHARGCPRIQLYTHFDDVLSAEVRGRMRELVRRRATAEPVAYLVGHREFFSLDFVTRPGVFIPRPETELLVMQVLEHLQGRTTPRVLDLCTGTGCIAVAVAVNLPGAQLTAIDASPDALQVAARNAERHQVHNRITLLEGDLFAPLPAGQRFDVIVSNPPYVATVDEPTLPPDVRLHEPPAALYAGADGLDVIRRIICDAPRYLAEQGYLLLEFSPEQAEAVQQLLAESGRFENVAVRNDLAQAARIVSSRLI